MPIRSLERIKFMFSILQDNLGRVPSSVSEEGDRAISGGAALSAAALAREDYPLARSGRRRALRRLLSLFRGLSGGLHFLAGDAGRIRTPLLRPIFRINFSRCILCGFCEEACPTNAIQLTPDFNMCEYNRQGMVYEKEDLLINGTGKYHEYNFYRVAGLQIGGKDKGEAENERPPVDVHSLMP